VFGTVPYITQRQREAVSPCSFNHPNWPNLAAGEMSVNICRGTLGTLAMFTAIRNASSRVSSFALERRPDSFSK
jgi:hypothetical protein